MGGPDKSANGRGHPPKKLSGWLPETLGWARDVRRRRRAVAAVAVAVAIAAAVAVAVAIAVVVVVVAAFRAYAGADASKQPPDMPDVFPHETAVAWTRQCLKKYPLTKGAGLGAMERELADRLDECKKYINAAYDVSDLCSSYTRRMEDPPRNLIHRPPSGSSAGLRGGRHCAGGSHEPAIACTAALPEGAGRNHRRVCV